jgi:uncharacterized membrane protein
LVTVSDEEDGWRDPERADDSVVPSNVRRVARLEEQQLRTRSTSERIAGSVTRAAGTATFAITHLWIDETRPDAPDASAGAPGR